MCALASCGQPGDGSDAAVTVQSVTAVPTSRLSDDYPDASAFAFGQEIVLTESQIVPAQLVSKVGKEVTVRNNTSVSQVVEFTNGPVDDRGVTRSDSIPPGGTWAFTPPRPISLTFRLQGQPDRAAALQVDVANF